MKSVNDLPIPALRLLVQEIQEELWWNSESRGWDRDKDWGLPYGLPTLQRIAQILAGSGLMPEEGHLGLSEPHRHRRYT